MYFFAPFVFCLSVFFALAFFGYLVHKDESGSGVSEVKMAIPLFIGVSFIISLAFSPIWNPSGLPIVEHIDPGTYKVAFVYVAGDNVNVAIESKKSTISLEEIHYRQFKKNAFEGLLNPNAKKLIVVQTGSFKKLRLE